MINHNTLHNFLNRGQNVNKRKYKEPAVTIKGGDGGLFANRPFYLVKGLKIKNLLEDRAYHLKGVT
jgi:hypothetical protein